MLHNTFILKKNYSSHKFVHYFEWGSKYINFWDVDRQDSLRVTLNNTFNIPKFCRTVVTDEGSKKNDEDFMIDVQAVLEAWREPHSKAKINFAEVALVKHGMCRLKNLWIESEE